MISHTRAFHWYLNDLEQRIDRYFALFYRIQSIWGLIASKWLKIEPYLLRHKCSPKNRVDWKCRTGKWRTNGGPYGSKTDRHDWKM